MQMNADNLRILELKDLYVNYGGIQALENINLFINSGEVVTLVGANGAGKQRLSALYLR